MQGKAKGDFWHLGGHGPFGPLRIQLALWNLFYKIGLSSYCGFLDVYLLRFTFMLVYAIKDLPTYLLTL